MKGTESKSKKELLDIKMPNYDCGNNKLSEELYRKSGRVEGDRNPSKLFETMFQQGKGVTCLPRYNYTKQISQYTDSTKQGQIQENNKGKSHVTTAQEQACRAIIQAIDRQRPETITGLEKIM